MPTSVLAQLLFDFLAFKNDIEFWRRRDSFAGLSTKAVLWRAFSQVVVFLYLMDEETSYLVIVPMGVGTVIEVGLGGWGVVGREWTG